MAFEQVSSANGVVWRRSSLLHAAGVPHGFSTRLGGVSPAPFDSLNLGLADAPGEPDAWPRVQRNWSRFVEAVGLEARTLVRARQVHGARVLQPDREQGVVREQPPFADGDALVTADPRHAISVRVADCAPVLLADPLRGIVAAVHAGWRGAADRIVTRAVAVMIERGAQADRLLAAVGPCIGFEAFQVGPEVREAFERAGLAGAIGPDPVPARCRLDLRLAIVQALQEAGLSPDRIEVDPTCTVSKPDTQFSYRREGARSGRMACIIGQSL